MKCFSSVMLTGLVLMSLGGCSSTPGAEVAASGQSNSGAVTIAKCQSENTIKGAKVLESAIISQLGKEISVDYRYRVAKDGKIEKGGETIVGNLDPAFKQVHDQNILGLLLESATLKVSGNPPNQLMDTVKSLGKTELTRKGDRLVIEENEIILNLAGCKF